ncbi:Adenine phosphoribosyltransferase 1 [Rhodotorula toruloides]|uniref:adenine phosphoribosyltransferase n=1 Tax=Rhodotorula toruloides TaxID=5286 RepID=A0A0K3CG70_RHOTO|nr:Adenine phosphoribosyltransferase 1 [Rhodotorula toruloides]PRQ73440.1 Phosphoribosyltransferase-like protein [Rhodotorula toruloides]
MSAEFLKSCMGQHPDFPQPGILFLDVFPILQNPVAFETLITDLLNHITSVTLPALREKTGNPSAKIDTIVGLDARGFLFGPLIALRLGAAFVPVRKQGKLPGKCFKAEYEKEYGVDVFEMQEGAIPSGSNVVVVDDLIATGGSAVAAQQLVEQAGAKVVQNLFVVEIEFLKGAEKLSAPTYSIIKAD